MWQKDKCDYLLFFPKAVHESFHRPLDASNLSQSLWLVVRPCNHSVLTSGHPTWNACHLPTFVPAGIVWLELLFEVEQSLKSGVVLLMLQSSFISFVGVFFSFLSLIDFQVFECKDRLFTLMAPSLPPLLVRKWSHCPFLVSLSLADGGHSLKSPLMLNPCPLIAWPEGNGAE